MAKKTPKRPGPPRSGQADTRISIRIPTETANWLDKIGAELEVGRSAVARAALFRGLEGGSIPLARILSDKNPKDCIEPSPQTP